MKKEISIVWFRQDLRLSDNPALVSASKLGSIMPIYILDYFAPKTFKIGCASKVWLSHSLDRLNQSLDSNLNVYVGKSSEIIEMLITQHNVKHVFCNACYEPWHVKQEQDVKRICKQQDVEYTQYNASYLWLPSQILKKDESYYKVFTAYKKKAFQATPRKTVIASSKMMTVKDQKNKISISDLDLIPITNHWYEKILDAWDISELAAQNKLNDFIANKLSSYKQARDYPNKNQTSRLSPHLHFGEISPAQIWESVKRFGHEHARDSDIEQFLNEIVWREFSSYLLHHFESLHKDNFNNKFDRFEWELLSNLVYGIRRPSCLIVRQPVLHL